jgi:hypothetical protein
MSIVTFVLIIDMKKSPPEGESQVPYAWEHWLRNFLDLKEACAKGKAQES